MTHTNIKAIFDRSSAAIELAKLRGETLGEDDGYYRNNDGSWIVTFKNLEGDVDDDMLSGQLCTTPFRGTAKRGQAYTAPDPEGRSRARRIAASWNATAHIPVEALEAGVIAELVETARSICATLDAYRNHEDDAEKWGRFDDPAGIMNDIEKDGLHERLTDILAKLEPSA